jgi:two-component system sensor histidine kinase KdpD
MSLEIRRIEGSCMNNDPASGRPDPHALLSEVERERRGALKIFLGASPGVGKTYKMLEAAREARRAGLDIVIGIVESHGRRETEALCEGLEHLPRAQIDYRGTSFAEMDLDAIIRRAPAVVLVDELAHRNIPGTRHPRRYQDVVELLEHGIDVWTTLNIQHLESLNDVVARITGVRMRETVPDTLLRDALDVVLVDLTPRELIERLKLGKVYVPEQARAAMDGFFSPSNLAALRELAFQTVTERIDHDLQEARQRKGTAGLWPVRARVIVAVDGNANSEEVVRHGRRLAERYRAPWTAVFVDRGNDAPDLRAGIDRAFDLAERLGGETAILRGYDPVSELLAYAGEQNATTLVIGRSRRRTIRNLFGRAFGQRLLKEVDEIDVVFVASSGAGARHPWTWLRQAEPLRHYVYALGVMCAAVAIAVAIESLLPLANLSLIFITGVLLVAVRTALRPALFAVLISALAYNFFFTEPRYSFAMYHTDDLLTVGFLLAMGLIGGRLAGRLRHQVLALRDSNHQIQTLLSVSRRLAAAADLPSVRSEIVASIAAHARAPAALLSPEGNNASLALTGASNEAVRLEWESDEKARSAAQWAFDRRKPSGFHTDTLGSLDWYFLPLDFERECFGVIGLYFGKLLVEHKSPTDEQFASIHALANLATQAIARAQLATNLEQSKISEETERLRSALLSSVSHDLRTPLATMLGSASSLRTLAHDLSKEDQAELLDSIISEGERLNRYIQNLLDMTRLGHGTLKLERDWIGIDDIVDAALRRTRDLLRNHHVTRNVSSDLPLLYVHPALIEQVLVNIIENAAKFTPAEGEIRLAASRNGDEMLIAISDEGPGIPPDQREKVFDMFYTGGESNQNKYGSGLGLAICRGMIGAHGGRIQALPGNDGRGTTIAIHLPIIAPVAKNQGQGA